MDPRWQCADSGRYRLGLLQLLTQSAAAEPARSHHAAKHQYTSAACGDCACACAKCAADLIAANADSGTSDLTERKLFAARIRWLS
jgi:hypothetical protein